MNRFGSNLNRRRKTKCQKNKKLKNGGQDGGQNVGSLFRLAIFETFINRFGSNSNCMRKIRSQKIKKNTALGLEVAKQFIIQY